VSSAQLASLNSSRLAIAVAQISVEAKTTFKDLYFDLWSKEEEEAMI